MELLQCVDSGLLALHGGDALCCGLGSGDGGDGGNAGQDCGAANSLLVKEGVLAAGR
jgi:hypothetical protein